MSINRSVSQIYFESMFPGNSGIPFKGLPKNTYEQRSISSIEANDIQNKLDTEISSLYYKALLSYMECIPAIKKHNYSWSTVRLYYSTYYATRAFLACNGIAIMRAERRLFYIKARANESFKRCDDHTDHKGTMLTLIKLFQKSDTLLSNTLNGENAYEWLMKRREEVNYKDMDFHDPNPPDFWINIDSILKSKALESLIDELVKDAWVYCFQSDYGILGIPTKRLMLTTNAINRLGKTIILSEEKKRFVEEFAKELKPSSQKQIIIWK